VHCAVWLDVVVTRQLRLTETGVVLSEVSSKVPLSTNSGADAATIKHASLTRWFVADSRLLRLSMFNSAERTCCWRFSTSDVNLNVQNLSFMFIHIGDVEYLCSLSICCEFFTSWTRPLLRKPRLGISKSHGHRTTWSPAWDVKICYRISSVIVMFARFCAFRPFMTTVLLAQFSVLFVEGWKRMAHFIFFY